MPEKSFTIGELIDPDLVFFIDESLAASSGGPWPKGDGNGGGNGDGNGDGDGDGEIRDKSQMDGTNLKWMYVHAAPLEIPYGNSFIESLDEKWSITLPETVIEKRVKEVKVRDEICDIFHVQTGFTARPPESFTIERVEVHIEFEGATNIGMAPMDEVNTLKVVRKRGLKPKIGVGSDDGPSAGVEFEYSTTEEIAKQVPRITQLYKGQPRAGWRIDSTPVRQEIVGDMQLEVLVRQKANSSTPAKMEVMGVLRNKHLHDSLLRMLLGKGPLKDLDQQKFTIQ